MSATLEAQRQRLDERVRRCCRQPEVHANELAALAREQALAAGAASLGAYLAISTDGFEPMRGRLLDRLCNRLRVAAAVDDPFAAQAAMLELRAALAAADATDAAGATLRAATEGTAWRGRGPLAAVSFAALAMNLIWAQAGRSPYADPAADARAAWRQWCDADPEAAAAWLRGDAPPRVRWRQPWVDDGPLRGWARALGCAVDAQASAPAAPPAAQVLAEGERLAAEWRSHLGAAGPGRPEAASPSRPKAASRTRPEPASQTRPEAAGPQAGAWPAGDPAPLPAAAVLAPQPDPALPPDPAPPLAPLLAGWQALAGAGPEAGATARRFAGLARLALALAEGAADVFELQRRWEAAGLPAAMAAAPYRSSIEAARERHARWPLPLRHADAQWLAAALDEAATEVEVELLAGHAHACLAVEADRQRLHLAAALAPARAWLLHELLGRFAEVEPAQAAQASAALLGAPPAALLDHPDVAVQLDAVLVPRAAGGDADFEVDWTEPGTELLPLLRQWRVASPRERLREVLAPLADRAAALPPVRFAAWGQPVAAADGWARGFALRPAVAGWCLPRGVCRPAPCDRLTDRGDQPHERPQDPAAGR